MMAITSNNYIKLHALFQFTLAIYLTRIRAAVSEQDFIYQGVNGLYVVRSEHLPSKKQIG